MQHLIFWAGGELFIAVLSAGHVFQLKVPVLLGKCNSGESLGG